VWPGSIASPMGPQRGLPRAHGQIEGHPNGRWGRLNQQMREPAVDLKREQGLSPPSSFRAIRPCKRPPEERQSLGMIQPGRLEAGPHSSQTRAEGLPIPHCRLATF